MSKLKSNVVYIVLIILKSINSKQKKCYSQNSKLTFWLKCLLIINLQLVSWWALKGKKSFFLIKLWYWIGFEFKRN